MMVVMEDMTTAEYLDSQQVADLLRVSPLTVRLWRRKRVGPPWAIKRSRVVYSKTELDEWFASNQAVPEHAPRVALDANEWLTAMEVVEWLHLPLKTLYRWRDAKKGPPAYRVGKYLRYRRVEVEAWLVSVKDKWEPTPPPKVRRQPGKPTSR